MNVLTDFNGIFHSFCRKPHSSLPLFYMKPHLYCTSTPPQSEDDLVSEVVSILKHHRSKTRWSRLRSLLTASRNKDLTPAQFSEIALQIRNNGHLVLRFFNFTLSHSLCSHSLLSYSTVIHLLSRARLKYHAVTIIKSAMCVFSASKLKNGGSTVAILESLIRTYRACDSAPFVFDLLVKACVESKKIDLAVEVYEILKSKNVALRTDTCNALIELVSKSQGGFAGYDLYMNMFNPDVDSTNKSGKGQKAIVPSSNTMNVVMMGFYKEGLVDKVEELWEKMVRVGCVPNLYSYNVLMAAYCDDGRMEESMRVFEEIECKGFKPDAVTYNTIIGGYCRVGEVEKGEEIYREMVTKGVESTCITYEHLINGYCEISDIDSAILLYKDMCRKSFSPRSSTINVIIRAFFEKNETSAALEFCRMAEKKHEFVLVEENYVGLIRGLCHEGKMEEALKLQVEMVSKGFDPSSELYDAFVDGYVKLRNDAMASKLMKEKLRNEMSKKK